jgi:ABC-2 type transport system permease protein
VLLGWRPAVSVAAVLVALLLILLGTATLSALGLVMAGTLRAEATLAAANIIWLVSVAAGGVVEPLASRPAGAARLLEALPLGALVAGLRTAFASGLPWADIAALAAWLLVGGVAGSRWFRWD